MQVPVNKYVINNNITNQKNIKNTWVVAVIDVTNDGMLEHV